MNYEEHYIYLGKLVANLQSLEFLLRAVLQLLPAARPQGIAKRGNIYSFPVGHELPESEMTSYDSLGELICKYNKEMADQQLSPIEGKPLVTLRDALAHGRVSAATHNGPLRLVKFGKPSGDKVEVLFNEEMSSKWFSSQIKRVYDAMQSVMANASSLKLDVVEISA